MRNRRLTRQIINIEFRTHRSEGRTVVIKGNFGDLADEEGLILQQVEHTTYLWQESMTIPLVAHNENWRLQGDLHRKLKFGLALRRNEYENQDEEEDNQGLRDLELRVQDGHSFIIEAVWNSPVVRIFPRRSMEMVEILCRVTFQNDDPNCVLAVLGNCAKLGNGIGLSQNKLERTATQDKWERRLKLELMPEDSRLKVPNGPELEELRLRIAKINAPDQVENGGEFSVAILSGTEQKKFDLECEFDGNHWLCPTMTLDKTPREPIMDLLANSVYQHLPHLPLRGNAEHDVRGDAEKFAKYLVPIINLRAVKGSYNDNTKKTSGDPPQFHDIWGPRPGDEERFDVNNSSTRKIVRSAIQYAQERQRRGLKKNKQAVCHRLTIKYHARENDVVDILNRINQQDLGAIPQQDMPNIQYKNVLMSLAKRVCRPEINAHWLSLFRHSAAIVRGRMEAALVSKECDVMHSDWYSCWKVHMEVAACWFVFMMAAWWRLDRGAGKNNRNFKESLTEPGNEVERVPNFYRWGPVENEG
ncbi:hypothetical protein BOX15_Mlig011641g1 [Macrostomum lignano]|uniref:Uncharacterized protein n=1 Tax=Macrostomum lignano TaxID=282301 RepID=A0A267FXW0_9PLAT|nr:hypothetical protein BOX15_Mlig011641g1 [Macrostomum lignano]